MLNLVAKHADCWISGEHYLDPSGANERSAFLHKACQRLGRDVAEIEVRRELVALLRDDSGTARSLAIDAGLRRDALDRPDYAIGDIDECITKIESLRENGVQALDVWLPLSQDQETLEKLGSGVIPVFS
jgi:alkanesulfonate monooxygenase SsuD/methylene tetrahydromethanopterin reductase-like flavin-dependent oxidoreductase (luciferase family)